MTSRSKCSRVVTVGNLCQVHDMNVVRSWSNHVNGDFWVVGTVDDSVLVQLGEFRPSAVSSSSNGSFFWGGREPCHHHQRLWTRRSVYTCVCVRVCACVCDTIYVCIHMYIYILTHTDIYVHFFIVEKEIYNIICIFRKIISFFFTFL